MVKNLPIMQETQVQSLGWEDPLEKGMATHASILTWRIPWTKEPWELQSTESLSQTCLSGWHFFIKIQTEVTDFIFLGPKIIADSHHSHGIKRRWLFGRKSMINLDNILKSRDITLPTKVCTVKAMFFPVLMYWCESETIKKGWVPKNWCFQTVVLEKTLQSPLVCKEVKQVNPKGNQPWVSIGRTNAKAPILWPPNVKSQLIGKDSDAGKDWWQEKKGTTEDEMVGWHHQFNGHEFEQIWANTRR